MKRKLTTVFCADVQSYSKMMARDEADTLQRLRRYRTIMEGLFERHDGRMVNTWGDAVIAEFSSVVEAVRCAVEIQDALSAENRDLPQDRQMWFRIGVNLGDVMHDDGDIYGDGVNVASRLQERAEAGGVMVSESVYQFAHKQLAIGFDCAGPQQVIDDQLPVVGYRVRIGGANSPRSEEEAAAFQAPPHDPGRRPPPGAASIAGTAPPAGPIEWITGVLEAGARWYSRQDRRVRRAAFMIAFFFAINLLFTGLATPWFIFPSAPFALYILMRGAKGEKD